MEYVNVNGETAHGEVWSPGPMPGTVWVQTAPGSSGAVVVKVSTSEQVRPDKVRAYLEQHLSDGRGIGYRDRFKHAPKLSAKVWHDALGYDPRAVVREDTLTLQLDVEEPVVAPEPVEEPAAAPEPVEEPVHALNVERKRVTRHFQRYTPAQRANLAASHRVGHRQRQSVGEYFYTHPDQPDVAFPTRIAAARAGLAARARAAVEEPVVAPEPVEEPIAAAEPRYWSCANDPECGLLVEGRSIVTCAACWSDVSSGARDAVPAPEPVDEPVAAGPRPLTPAELDALRERSISALRPGDRLVTPARGMAYVSRPDGAIVPQVGWASFMATVRVVTAIDGTLVTARGTDGRSISQDAAGQLDRHVLVIPRPEPVEEPPALAASRSPRSSRPATLVGSSSPVGPARRGASGPGHRPCGS